jgi:hypothetical protein
LGESIPESLGESSLRALKGHEEEDAATVAVVVVLGAVDDVTTTAPNF